MNVPLSVINLHGMLNYGTDQRFRHFWVVMPILNIKQKTITRCEMLHLLKDESFDVIFMLIIFQKVQEAFMIIQ